MSADSCDPADSSIWAENKFLNENMIVFFMRLSIKCVLDKAKSSSV